MTVKPQVTLAVKPLHLLRPVDRDPLARRLAEPAVQEPGFALILVAARPAPERPFAHPQQLGRLFLIELRKFPTVQKAQKPRHAHSLSASLRRIQNPPKGPDHRTGRALPKPDISCATDTPGDVSLPFAPSPYIMLFPVLPVCRLSRSHRLAV